MRTQLRNFFSCRHSIAPIVSFFRHANRAELLDSPEKASIMDYLVDAPVFLP